MDPKRFVRKVWQGLPRDPQKEESGKWAMGQGMVWLRQPEMWCPHCEVSWINPWIWLVNVKKGKVEGVWGEDGVKLGLSGRHPHVMANGEVCLGNGSVVEALTSGFNILSCFCGTESFVEVMAGLGHKGCGQDERMEEEEDDDRLTCESCDERYDDVYISYYDEPGSYLCDSCWRNQSVKCDNCQDRFYYPDDGSQRSPLTEVRGGDEFCDSCLEDYTYCEECEEYVHDEDMREWLADEEPICKRCWRDARSECQECGRLEPKEDVSDGICQRCLDRIEEEDTAMTNDDGEQLELPLTAGEAEDGTED